jgi:tRNA(Ile)-lysidine synthase
VQWQGEGALDIPELGGVLYFDVTLGQGISLKKLQQGMVTVRLRRGSEHFRPDGNRPTRTLKNLLQEQGMPPWQREMLPLLFCNETLIAIPSIGVACDYQTLQGEAGVVLRWCAIA